MDLIKNHELDVTDKIRTLVQHASQNLGSHLPNEHQVNGDFESPILQATHDKTRPFCIDLNVSCQNPNVTRLKRRLEISEFLVAERFYRRGIDRSAGKGSHRFRFNSYLRQKNQNLPRHMFHSQSNRIFSDYCLSC